MLQICWRGSKIYSENIHDSNDRAGKKTNETTDFTLVWTVYSSFIDTQPLWQIHATTKANRKNIGKKTKQTNSHRRVKQNMNLLLFYIWAWNTSVLYVIPNAQKISVAPIIKFVFTCGNGFNTEAEWNERTDREKANIGYVWHSIHNKQCYSGLQEKYV